MAIVTKTIHSSGGDYASPAAAATAFNAGTVAGAVASDDIVFNITENAAFDSRFVITANPTGYASYTLTVDPAVRHNGTYGSGGRIAISTTVESACADSVAALNGTIEWLEITTSGAGKIAAGWNLGAGYSSGKFKIMENCMVHDNGNHSTSPSRTAGIGYVNSGTGRTTCNLRVINTLVSKWKSGASAIAMGIAGRSDNNTLVTNEFLNCTIDEIDVLGGVAGTVYGIAVGDANTRFVKNCVVTRIGVNTTGGTKACYAGNGASTVGANNASDDTSAFGSSTLLSIVRGDNLNAPDSGDYRPLNDAAPIFGSGVDLVTTPTGIEFDLKSRDRDTMGDLWSRGAYQLSAGGAVVNTIAITAPVAYVIKQRIGGAFTFTISGSFSGVATTVECRVNGGAWSTLDAAPAAGVWTGTRSIPEGTNTIEVRLSNDTGVTDSVSNVLVGDVFLIAGQSNGDGRLTNQQSYTHGSQKASVFDPDDTAWRNLTDPASRTGDGTPWPLLATEIMAFTGVPCGFIPTADTGTLMTEWWNGGAAAKWTAAKARVTSSGVNAIAAMLWDQGESDISADTDPAAYNTNLDGLVGDVWSTYACPVIVVQTGTRPTGSAASIDAIRGAQVEAWDDNAHVKPGPTGYDRELLHWETDAEGITLAGRWYLSINQALYSGTQGRGPQVSVATVNPSRTQIEVRFDADLYADTTYASAAWSVKLDGTPQTISSVVRSGASTARITLSSAAAAGTLTVAYASGDTASNVVIPRRQITLPSALTIFQPAEPFYSQPVDAAPSNNFLFFF